MRICNPLSRLLHGLCASALTVLYTGGCASNQASREASTPKSGIEEYHQIALRADQAIRRALDSLASVAAQSNQCSPEVLRSFSAEIDKLQIESMQVRERSQAMQSRGDAYFERWQENMARVNDPTVRTLAERHRPELEESFRRIKALSKEGREAFDPFLAGLRTLRNALEKDPASIDADASRNNIKQAMQYGQRAGTSVTGIIRELDSLRALLVPAEKPARN